KLWGYKSKKEAIGNSISSFFASPDEVAPIFETLNETGKWESEFLAKRCDGSTFISQGFASAIYNEKGDKIGFQSVNLNITKRKEVEQKLKSEKEKAQKYLDIAGVIIVALNTDQTVQLINQKGCEFLEEEESKIIGMNWFDNYIPENVREQVKKDFNRIIAGEIEPLEYYENPLITKDGEIRVIAWHNQILKNKAGQIIGTLSSGLDITERKKMMEELHIKDIVFNASLSAQSIADINGIIDDVNPAFLKLWGYKSKEEAIGNSFGSYLANPDDVVTILEALTETGKWEGEFLAKRYDGSRFISQGFASTIYNEKGSQIGFQSANLDITKRKEAEEKLKESEEKYRYLIENSLEGVWVIDSNANTILINPSMAKMLGYTIEEMVGKSLFLFMDEKEIKNTKRHLERRKKGISEEQDSEMIHKNGKKVYLRIRASPIFDIEGNYEGTFAFLSNITQRKLTEQNLKESEEKYRYLF
ncbi:MAG: PAS domain S-box protein, partial [Candidatus Lokiarchaeota archaeon]|nr:PAS domain S-box protein [Candidatus Lokiarchaeota archaeon]